MIHFIGIKGTGMAALAVILKDLGYEVQGSDLEKHFFTEDALVANNIKILPFDKNNIKDNMTVIIGNAFKEDFAEVIQARNNKTCTCYRYHEYLGKLMENYESYSVCGSHGKTTTTTMLETMFKDKFDTGYLIGDGSGYLDKSSKLFILESCEYRRHFLAYHPDYAIVTNIEIDHVDYYKTKEDYLHAYLEFGENVSKGIMAFGDDEETRKFHAKVPTYFYGLNENNDLRALNLKEYTDHMTFDVEFKNEFVGSFNLPFVGHHMLFNALGCIGIGLLKGMSVKEMNDGLSNFKGAKRRYVIENYLDNVYIDDYAHHPTEVKLTIEATRKRYPDRKIVAIFKPHRVSRVYYFKDQFKEALSLADDVYLCDFTSIDDKEDGIDIDITYLQKEIPNAKVLSEDDEGAKVLAQYHNAVLLFMSSKDIYELKDLVKRYQKP